MWPRLALALLWGICPTLAMAAPVANPVASFSGLDKITARVSPFEAFVGETVQFGALQITPRACYTRPADEPQQTAAFVEVDRVDLKGASRRIFTGWMFADSPALNAIDDPLYDFWLTGCARQTDLPPPTALNPLPGPAAPPADTAGQAPSVPASGKSQTPPTQVQNGSIITLGNPTPNTAPPAAP